MLFRHRVLEAHRSEAFAISVEGEGGHVVSNCDVFEGQKPFDENVIGEELIEESHDIDVRALACQKNRILKGAIGVPDHHDGFTGIERPIAHGTIADAVSKVLVFAFDVEVPVLDASCDDHAFSVVVIRRAFDEERLPVFFNLLGFIEFEFRAERSHLIKEIAR